MSVLPGFVRVGSVLLAVVALAAGARAGVIVVDPGGSDGSALLQAALNDALDGDIVLVRDGIYTTFAAPVYYTVARKGITLATDAATPPTLGPLQILDVPHGSTFTLRGFTLGMLATPSDLGSAAPGVKVKDAGGAVWIEDCTINGMNGSGFSLLANTSGSSAVQVENSPAVTLQRCTLTGGRGADYSAPSGFKMYATSGGNALDVALNSSVSLHDCTALGGAGGNGTTISPGTEFGSGGDGAFLSQGSSIDLADCTLTGASNGSGNVSEWDFAGNGLTLENSSGFERDCTFTPGVLVGVGQPGVPVWPSISALLSYPAPPRHFAVTSPLQEGAPGTITVNGQPGDAVTLLIALENTWTVLQSKQGVLLLNPAPALLIMPLATTTLSGDLSVGFTTPNLPASVMGVTIPMQLLIQSGDGLTLEASSALTWLDASL